MATQIHKLFAGPTPHVAVTIASQLAASIQTTEKAEPAALKLSAVPTAIALSVITVPTPIAAALEQPPALVNQSNEKSAEPVLLSIVVKQPAIEPETAPILPASAVSTGQNFQFAARLKSVHALNRPLRTIVVPAAAKRIVAIEPPAVLRKKRQSAEVIHLNLRLARAQHKQARTRAAA